MSLYEVLGLMAILTLHRRQFAVLRALGATRLHIILCVWTQIAVIAVAGALVGLLLGSGAAIGVSHVITRVTLRTFPTWPHGRIRPRANVKPALPGFCTIS
jgi:ABC-type antimicrobial peptide transport system permease subunit